MIAMPFHPRHTYTIDELNSNLMDILMTWRKAAVSLEGKVPFTLKNKVRDGRLYVDQGIIAGCAGGGFENICDAADILRGASIGADAFTLSVYPASTPIYMELAKNGVLADLLAAGAVVKTAFCGSPVFGAGDTPANNAFSIRHTTRNFPNREGSKIQNGQISSVALMDARSIAATAANKGYLTPATSLQGSTAIRSISLTGRSMITVFLTAKERPPFCGNSVPGPNIKDWPATPELTENLVLKVVSEIHDPVTTTDELIPSGETSSYRSNPLGLAEFTLSRKDPAYVGLAKEVQTAEKAREEGKPGGSAGRIKAGVEDDQSQLSGSRPHEYRCGKYDLCCESQGCGSSPRAGGFLPESSWGDGLTLPMNTLQSVIVPI